MIDAYVAFFLGLSILVLALGAIVFLWIAIWLDDRKRSKLYRMDKE